MDQPNPPALPQGYGRRDVIALLSEIRSALNLSPRLAEVLIKIIGSTAEKAWNKAEEPPVFYGHQQTLALRLGISARQLRRHEAALVREGFVIRKTQANGGRCGRFGLGLYLTPILERFTEFLDLRDHGRAAQLRIRKLKALRCQRWQEFMETFRRLSFAGTTGPLELLLEKFRSWPRTDRLLTMPEEELTKHLDEATSLCTEIAALDVKRPQVTGEPVQNDRSHIQRNRQKTSTVTCTADSENGDDDTIARNESQELHVAVVNRIHQNQLTGPKGFEKILDAATPEFRQHMVSLDHPPCPATLADAAALRCVELAISQSAWHEACASMGRVGASMSVLIVDANRTHPKSPVRNPGGALRAMSRAAQAGKLNLAGSLIGLLRRAQCNEGYSASIWDTGAIHSLPSARSTKTTSSDRSPSHTVCSAPSFQRHL